MNFKLFGVMLQNSLLNAGDSGTGGEGSGEGTGDSGAAGTGDSGDSGSTDGVPGEGESGSGDSGGTGWLSGVDPDIAGNASIAKFTSVESLGKAYIQAQGMIGADKMVIPNKNSSADDWRGAFNKLGLPEKREEYGVERAAESPINEEFHKSFTDKAFELGVMPDHAKALLDMYGDSVNKTNESLIAQKAKDEAAGVETLKTEWGDAFDRKLQAANYTLSEFGGKELVSHLNELGLGNDPKLVKFLADIGEAKTDDVFRGESKEAFGLSAEEAKNQIDAMLGDPKHPIHHKEHAEHNKYKKEYNRLGPIAFPGKK